MWAERRFVEKSIVLETSRLPPLPHTTEQLTFGLCSHPGKKLKVKQRALNLRLPGTVKGGVTFRAAA